MNKINGQYRQGDVLVQRVERIPAAVVKQTLKRGERIILAHGEATGHHHSIMGRSADWWRAEPARASADNGPGAGGVLVADQFVEVKEATPLVHQEHAPIPLAPGRYRAVRQREYSPEALRNVAD